MSVTAPAVGTNEAAREERSLLGEAIDHLADAIVVYDANLRVVDYNAAWRKLMSYLRPGEDLRGIHLSEIHDANVELGLWTRERADEVYIDIAANKFTSGAQRISNIDGRYQRHRNIPLPGGGFVGIRSDVTELVLREKELERAKREADAASHAKSTFLAMMSHELRTPLNAVIGFAEMLRNGVFGPLGDPRYAEYAEDIVQSGRHLLETLNDVLDVAKLESGRVEVDLKPERLASVVEELANVLAAIAARGGHALDYALDADCVAAVDRRRLKQILLNLATNAAKYTRAGGRIVVGVARRDDGQVALTVEDNGIGMAPSDVARATELFTRFDHQLEHNPEGVGIGLYVIRRLAEAMGAQLKIDSKPGVGTRASVIFPAR
jgi:signal transduction histidine kinase